MLEAGDADAAMIQPWMAWRLRRHIGVALMTSALLLGAYLLWSSTSRHAAVNHRLTDSLQTRLDSISLRRTRHHGSHKIIKDLSNPQLAADAEENTNQFGVLRKQSRPIPLISSSISDTFRRVSASNGIVPRNYSTFFKSIRRFRPIRSNNEEDSVITLQKENLGKTQSATVDDNRPTFTEFSNRRRTSRSELLQEPRGTETGSMSDWPNYSNRRESRLRTNTVSANILHSVTNNANNEWTPRPLYLVVSNDKEEKDSVPDFKEPDVVIRSADADMPRRKEAASNVSREYGPGGGKRSPLLGMLHGGAGNCRVYNTRSDLPELSDFAAGVDCFDLATTPTVVVCPYPNTDDRHLSEPLRAHGIWEPHVVRLFQAALMTDKALGVYDIGANIGQYSLLAAAMGRRVVAAEMHRPNIYRMHKAIRLGRLEEKIVVVQNAVSDERETFELEVKDGDPSGVRLTTQDADRFCDEPECRAHATTILLDDLLEVTNFDAAVMKIDIEGYEHRAFSYCEELLRDVRVAYIFMEWIKMRELYGAEVDDNADKRLVQRMIRTLSRHRYLPYAVTNAPARTLDARLWYAWPDDIVWVLAGSVEPDKLAELAPDVPSSKLVRGLERSR